MSADADQTVEDPEQHHRRSRLRTLQECRERAKAVRLDAAERVEAGTMTRQHANFLLATAVKSYIEEIKWPLLGWIAEQAERANSREGFGEDEDGDDGPGYVDYWEGYPLGTMVLPDGRRRSFGGLRDFHETPPRFEVEYTEERRTEVYGRRVESVTERVTIPWEISMAAMDAADAWMDEVGAGVRLTDDDGLPSWGFEEVHYADPEKDVEVV